MTPAPSVKRKVARGALLCSQGRGQDGESRCDVRLSSIRARAVHDQLTPSRAGRASRGFRREHAVLSLSPPFPREKGNRKIESEKPSSAFRDFLSPGAGVTPAEGSLKPTAGFKLNQVISPSLTTTRRPRRLARSRVGRSASSRASCSSCSRIRFSLRGRRIRASRPRPDGRMISRSGPVTRPAATS